MIGINRTSIIAFVAGLVHSILPAQVYDGRVMDSRYSTGIDSVKVTLVQTGEVAYTNELGNFSFRGRFLSQFR